MKLLLGGSPCTHWSIAQTRNRETQPEGLGWELFRNYLIAKERYGPDFYLYENNKSMAPAIRAQITAELGVEPLLINSALVSAQSRQRLYWTNIHGVELPEDRGILLRDILDSGVCWREKAYTLDANYYKSGTAPFLHQSGKRLIVAEPVSCTKDGKAYTLKANYAKASIANALDGGHFPAPMVIEPLNVTAEGKAQCLRASCYKDGIRNLAGNPNDRRTCVAQPIRIGAIESSTGSDGQGHRVYSADGKSKTLCGNGGGAGAKTGLYTVPADSSALLAAEAAAKGDSGLNSRTDRERTIGEQANCLTTSCQYYPYCGTLDRPVYEVRGGQFTIKGQQYPIKLMDGCYTIRKLTVRECMRLQTVPEDFVFPVSDTQAYKMLGNGWTVDVIAHILSYCPGVTTEPLEVLSMYDGMSCGHLALDKLGANVLRYYATEIDKYAIKTTQTNFPDAVQLGDAFQVREDEWWSFFDH